FYPGPASAASAWTIAASQRFIDLDPMHIVPGYAHAGRAEAREGDVVAAAVADDNSSHHGGSAEAGAQRTRVRRPALPDAARPGAEPLRPAPRVGAVEARGSDADLLVQDPRRLQQDRTALRGRARGWRDRSLGREPRAGRGLRGRQARPALADRDAA